MAKSKSTYILGVLMQPIMAPPMLIFWILIGAWHQDRGVTLENGVKVQVGSWKWYWYRLVLGYATVWENGKK